MRSRVVFLLHASPAPKDFSGSPRHASRRLPHRRSPAVNRVPFSPRELLTYDVSYSTYVTAGTVTMLCRRSGLLQFGRLLRRRRSATDAADVEGLHALLQGRRVDGCLYAVAAARWRNSEEGTASDEVTTFNNAARKATFEHVSAKSGKRNFSAGVHAGCVIRNLRHARVAAESGLEGTIPGAPAGAATTRRSAWWA